MPPVKKPVTLNIEALTERQPYLKVLVYGESGVGKTVFASTAPRPILWLESEGGTHSIGDKTGIDIARVEGLDTYREALLYLEANPGKYRSVVIDSFSETQAAVLKDIMKAVVTIDPNRDEFQPQFGEWGRLVGVMREIARAYRDLPLNLVVTALAREDKDEMTGRVKVTPRLSPTLSSEVPAFMDAVIYLYTATLKGGEVDRGGVEKAESGDKVTIVRNGLLKPTGKYAAKLRVPYGKECPDYITNPTFEAIASLVGITPPKPKSPKS